MSKYVALLVLLTIICNAAALPSSRFLVSNVSNITGKIYDEGQTECYAVMIDAGSSSSKYHIYNFICEEMVSFPDLTVKENVFFDDLKPPLSSFASNVSGIAAYLEPIMNNAKATVPEKLWGITPFMVFATAGLRLLSAEDQAKIMDETFSVVESSVFYTKKEYVRVIAGYEEGAYLWLTANYLLNLLQPGSGPNTTYILDMGGASTQIAGYSNTSTTNIVNMILQKDYEYQVFSISFLEFGADQMQKKISQKLIKQDSLIIDSPCYPKKYSGKYSFNNSYTINGTGNSAECLGLIRENLNMTTCNEGSSTCTINGEMIPNLHEINPKFLAVSVFYYSAKFFKIIKGTTNSTKIQDYFDAAKTFLETDYNVLKENVTEKELSYLYQYGIQALYCYSILTDAYHLNNGGSITPQIVVNGVGVGWALGSVIYELSVLDIEPFNITTEDVPLKSNLIYIFKFACLVLMMLSFIQALKLNK